MPTWGRIHRRARQVITANPAAPVTATRNPQPAARQPAVGSGLWPLLTCVCPPTTSSTRRSIACDDRAHGSLAAAESALRAEAAIERRFDQLLLRVGFPPRIDATAWGINRRQLGLALPENS
jgi:hypothetical protein